MCWIWSLTLFTHNLPSIFFGGKFWHYLIELYLILFYMADLLFRICGQGTFIQVFVGDPSSSIQLDKWYCWGISHEVAPNDDQVNDLQLMHLFLLVIQLELKLQTPLQFFADLIWRYFYEDFDTTKKCNGGCPKKVCKCVEIWGPRTHQFQM